LAFHEPEAFPQLTLEKNLGATYFICRNELGTVSELLRRDELTGEYIINGATLNSRHRALRDIIDWFIAEISKDDVFKEPVEGGEDPRAIRFVELVRDFVSIYHLAFNDLTKPRERGRALRQYLAGEPQREEWDRLAKLNVKRKTRGRKNSKKNKAARGTASL